MLQELFAVIAPVFICAGIGFWWQRSGRVFDTDMVTNLVTYVGVPAMVFTALSTIEADLLEVRALSLGVVLALIAFAVIGWAVLAVFGLPQRAYLPTLMFPNIGNMGLPLNLLAFGEQGFAFAVVVFAIVALVQFTIGFAIASGSLSLRTLLRNPVVYAVALSLPFLFSTLEPPAAVLNATRLLGNMAVPVMLITLGVSLAKLGVANLGRSVGLSVLRLVMGFAVGVVLAQLLGMEGVARGVLIVQCAMPVAVFNYLFALRYDNQPSEVAGMVVISTVLSFATLPLLIGYVLGG